MSANVWRWQVLDRRDEIQTFGTVDMWGTPAEQHDLAQRWAADKMALMLYDAEPRWERLAGWRVRVWSDRHGLEAISEAEEWLSVLRAGPLARMSDRVELLPRVGVRR
ncbi:hypothetical protein AB0J14_04870 [Micromonospora arborensis]|uniref:hypothetical protein n=1 Tax=Micromonospora arborensis TaxID=2116518 RepID=UPI0033F5664A